MLKIKKLSVCTIFAFKIAGFESVAEAANNLMFYQWLPILGSVNRMVMKTIE
jgi:hypothetical protein